MKLINSLSLKIALYAICFLLSLSSIFATESDLELEGAYDKESRILTFNWTLSGATSNIRFEIYSHYGTVYLNENFLPDGSYLSDTLNGFPIGDKTKFQASFERYYALPRSYYIKAIYPDSSVKTSKVVYVADPDGPQWLDIIYIKSEPPSEANIGLEYVYKIKAESANKLPIHFKIEGAPNGTKFDEAKGLVTWTPTQVGEYQFAVYCWTQDTNHIYKGSRHVWVVKTPKCYDLSKIFGIVIDKDGSPLDSGYVWLNLQNVIPRQYYKSKIVEGKYEFMNMDAGEYEISVYSLGPGQAFKHEKDYDLILGCGESRQIDFNLAPPNMDNEIKFDTKPPAVAALGNEYKYIAKANAKNANLEIKYKLLDYPFESPVTEVYFNENTGELKWTPDSLGIYKFIIQAYAPDKDFDDELDEYQTWDVNVIKCVNPATVNIKIIVHKNVFMEPVEINFDRIDPIDTTQKREIRRYWEEAYRYKIDTITFQCVDAGVYLLKLLGNCVHNGDMFVGLYDYWYESGYVEEDATPINVECGEVKNITLNVIPKEPQYHRVTGQVVSEDGFPIAGTSVSLYWNNLLTELPVDKWKGVVDNVITDKEGKYELWARTSTYVAVATPPVDPTEPIKYTYKELYYNQTPSIKEAEQFKLTGSLGNINFVFPKQPKRHNSIAGNISYEDGLKQLKDIEVILYYVEPLEEYKQWKDYSFIAKTTQDGSYIINDLMPGKYIAFAAPSDGENFFGGYYSDGEDLTDNWKSATRLVVDESSQINNVDIRFKKIKGVIGAGKINGVIFGDKIKQIIKLVGDEHGERAAIAGANVYVFNKEGECAGFERTDFAGKFTVSNLSPGHYILKADRVGFDFISVDVSLSEKDSAVSVEVALPLKGIYEKPELTFCQVAPNPAVETLKLDFTAEGATRISLVNSLGVKVYSKELGVLSGASTHSIDLVSLPQGSYYVIVESGARASALPVAIIR